MNILDEIIEYKKSEVIHRKKQLTLNKIISEIGRLPLVRDFESAVAQPSRLNLIAEIKKASPSSGRIVENFDVREIARQYEESGAAAVSVLTDIKYFQGDISYINIVKEAISLPVLRKDFIIDDYQIYESRYFGADAILLIAAVLNRGKIRNYLKIADELNLSAIVEVHKEEELKEVVDTGARIIGINNRDLSDLSVDINTTLILKPKIPKGKTVISESGIKTKQHVNILKNSGVNAVLIGEYFMKSESIEESVKNLFGK
ncbi:MAG: indole-3-glycerol phosphate synthase TrpC [Elusimicrobia bacterium]|nr:indole-3-glycerol phosphate synthase TrpC [Elusimicrobiota bacterium]